jgi:hypothetical protein
MAQIRSRTHALPGASGCFEKRCYFVGFGLDSVEGFLEVIFRVLPLEGFGDFVVEVFKSEYGHLEGYQISEVVGREDFSLENGEDYFDLVEPTGVYRSMDLDSVGVPIQKPLYRRFATMRRTIVCNPEDASGGSVRLLSHDQVHQLVVGLNSGLSFTYSEQLAPVNIPGGKIGQCALSCVFGLHTARLMRQRTDANGFSVSCLNTGLFVSTDHIVIWPQEGSCEHTEIQIQDALCLFCEERVSGKEPATMVPRLDGIIVQITPDGLDTYGKHEATGHGLVGDIGMTETGKGKSQFTGEFAGQRLDLHNALGGKKSAVGHTSVGPQGRPGLPRRNASSIW